MPEPRSRPSAYWSGGGGASHDQGGLARGSVGQRTLQQDDNGVDGRPDLRAGESFLKYLRSGRVD
jgi:hypothetical protein